MSLAPQANQKLAFNFFGPFQVLEKIGAVTYKVAAAGLILHTPSLSRVSVEDCSAD